MIRIAGLVIGSKWIVDKVVVIAEGLRMSQATFSLTIVLLGKLLPELAKCVVTAMKRNADIVIGNVIGSNIFNLYFVLGTNTVIKPLPFTLH